MSYYLWLHCNYSVPGSHTVNMFMVSHGLLPSTLSFLELTMASCSLSCPHDILSLWKCLCLHEEVLHRNCVKWHKVMTIFKFPSDTVRLIKTYRWNNGGSFQEQQCTCCDCALCSYPILTQIMISTHLLSLFMADVQEVWMPLQGLSVKVRRTWYTVHHDNLCYSVTPTSLSITPVKDSFTSVLHRIGSHADISTRMPETVKYS